MTRTAGAIVGLSILLLAACGGGGGGGSSPAASNQTSISVSPQNVLVAGTTTDLTVPSAFVQITASSPPSAGLYVSSTATSNGISAVALSTISGTDEQIAITFRLASALGVGVYNDTITVTVCYDQQCHSPVTNSPQTISVQYTVTLGNPLTATPTLSSLSPDSAAGGSAGAAITATGTNFAMDSVVYLDTAPLATTYVSSTQLTATIPALSLASAGPHTVVVSNQSGGGGTSSSLPFTVSVVPQVIASLNPASVNAGGSPFILSVTGSGFEAGASVQWNGAARPTIYASATQLYAEITAADIASAGLVPVTVQSPNTATPLSNPVNVSVADLPLALSALSPGMVDAGGPGFQLTVQGSGFTSASVVQWNGSARPTTLVSTGELVAQIAASDIAVAASASVAVVNSTTASTAPAVVTIASPSVDAIGWRNNAQQSGAVSFATILPPASWPTTAAGTWAVSFSGAPTYAMVAGGSVFVLVNNAGANTQLYALNATNGQTLWGPLTFPGVDTAVYDAGTIFFLQDGINTNGSSNGPGQLIAIDAATGTTKWTSSLNLSTTFLYGPVAGGGVVYVSGTGGQAPIYAVNESNGAFVWIQYFADDYPLALSPDGLILDNICGIFALRPLTGEPFWSENSACASAVNTGFAAVGNGVAYGDYGTSGAAASSVNAETGTFIRSVPSQLPALGANTGYFLSSPGGGASLSAVNLSTGTNAWTFAGDGSLETAPLLVNQYVFVGSLSGNLYALDATMGSIVWQVQMGAALNGIAYSTYFQGITAGDGWLMVPSGKTLTAFKLSNSP